MIPRATMRHVAISLTLVACAGNAPPSNPIDDVDAGVDAPPIALGKKVSGKVMDYFGAVPLSDTMIATDGIDPPKNTTTNIDGNWELLDVPVGSKVFLATTRLNYRPTRNVAVAVDEMDVVQDVYALSVADVNRNYTSRLGALPIAGNAFVAVELQRNNGTPLEGVALADVVLHDALDQPVLNLNATFMGAVDVDPLILVSTAVNGRSRVALFNVPPGAYTLKVPVINGQGGTDILTTPIVAVADGATLGKLGGMGMGGMPNVTDPKFTVDIYPRLQRAALGGTGCANCHTALGTAALLIFDDGATAVQARLTIGINGRIDTTTPANSMLLTKPLYELTPPQNHPNATYLDVNDLDYKLIMLWIQNGLKP